MQAELKQMYLDMSAECSIKDTIIESLSKKIKSTEKEISKMFKMVNYPRLVGEM